MLRDERGFILATIVLGKFTLVPPTARRSCWLTASGTHCSREGDELPALSADLVRQHVTVIAAFGTSGTRTAKAATQTIPVIFVMAADPVETGVAASLNRPSGNLTGADEVIQ
jgi:hypothetical protein